MCTLPHSCFYSHWYKLVLVTNIIETLLGSNMSLWPTTVWGFSNHLNQRKYVWFWCADSRAKVWPVKYIKAPLQFASAAACSKVVILLLVHCFFCECLVLVLWCNSSLVIISQKETAGGFTLIVCGYLCSVSIPHGTMGCLVTVYSSRCRGMSCDCLFLTVPWDVLWLSIPHGTMGWFVTVYSSRYHGMVCDCLFLTVPWDGLWLSIPHGTMGWFVTVYSSWCHGMVCNYLWSWHFLVILFCLLLT